MNVVNNRNELRIILPPLQTASRTLFDDRSLHLETYRKNRIDAHNNIEHSERFKWELKSYVENVKPLDLTNLKNSCEILMHLVGEDSYDIDLVRQVLLAFNTANASTVLKHTMGNLTMKAFHVINDTDGASRLYLDSELNEHFAGVISMLLYYDMMYKNGQYDKIMSLDTTATHQLRVKSGSSIRFLDALFLGACYKLVC